MRKLPKLLLALAVLAAALAGNPAAGERLRIIPVPPHVVPQWTPMPDLPQVYYAPNVPTDVFRHRGRYYFYWEAVWYKGKSLKGPWMRVDPPPAILYQINAAYFKTTPKGAAQPPGAPAPTQPPPGEGLVTPEGTPVVPPAPTAPEPTAPVPPTPPSGAYAPPPQAVPPPEQVTPPQEPVTPPPPEQATPAPPESQESAPQAVPEGPMPKAM